MLGGTPEVENTRRDGGILVFVGDVLRGEDCAALRVRLCCIGEGEGGPLIVGMGGVDGLDGGDLIESKFLSV
jgi:hypothetical protein